MTSTFTPSSAAIQTIQLLLHQYRQQPVVLVKPKVRNPTLVHIQSLPSTVPPQLTSTPPQVRPPPRPTRAPPRNAAKAFPREQLGHGHYTMVHMNPGLAVIPLARTAGTAEAVNVYFSLAEQVTRHPTMVSHYKILSFLLPSFPHVNLLIQLVVDHILHTHPPRDMMQALAPTPAHHSCLQSTLPDRTQAPGCTRNDPLLGRIIHGTAAAVTRPQPVSTLTPTYQSHERNALLIPLSPTSTEPLNLHATTQRRRSSSFNMHPLLAHTRPSPTTSCTPRPRAPSWTAPRTLEQVEVRDERATTTAALLPTPHVEPRPGGLGGGPPDDDGPRKFVGAEDDARYTRPSSRASPPQEWEALCHGLGVQKVAQVYEKRCKRLGGGWDGGLEG